MALKTTAASQKSVLVQKHMSHNPSGSIPETQFLLERIVRWPAKPTRRKFALEDVAKEGKQQCQADANWQEVAKHRLGKQLRGPMRVRQGSSKAPNNKPHDVANRDYLACTVNGGQC